MPALKPARLATALALSSLCVCLGAPSAFAGNGNGQQPPPPPGGGGGGGGSIESQVQFHDSRPGKGAKPMAPVAGNWSPPACWYEPQYKPKEFQDYLASHSYPGSAGEQQMGEYSDETHGKYHEGDEGAWYALVQNPAASSQEYAERCGPLRAFEWVGPAKPPPPNTPVITPQILAGLAYNRTKLPSPPVTLQPTPDKLKVNLPTRVSFEGGLDPVWVTASFNAMGVNIAATTVATPKQLRLDAGTDYADPQSCTYDLVKKGDTYAVDSGESGCLITYRKSSGTGTYNLHASITWDVTWNPTAGPGGQPVHNDLPDGETESDIPVTVKEIQSVNR